MTKPVYLDYNATAPVKPAIRDLMMVVLGEVGNASSLHGHGRKARGRIDRARAQIAALTGAQANYVVFTAGATESNNAVLRAFSGQNIHISAIEHPSVTECAPDATYIPVTKDGVIDLQAWEDILKSGNLPALVSIMLVNNETGVIQPVAKAARLVKTYAPDVYIHTDAAQAAGRIAIDMPSLYADYLSLSAHKTGGPQGVGALLIAPGAQDCKLIYGGGQEQRRRAGTENVAAIAAFGLAAELAGADMADFAAKAAWRDALEGRLCALAPELKIYGRDTARVANTIAMALPGVPAQTQLMALDLAGFSLSSGAACSSGTVRPSATLIAMGASEDEAGCALRLSFGWDTAQDDLDRFFESWKAFYERIRPDLQKQA